MKILGGMVYRKPKERPSCSDIEEIMDEMAELDKFAPGGWIYEDELPDDYPYDAMFPYSIVDVVRLFPRLPQRWIQ